ncbi:MAG: O-antigen ligase C-terminal domain-containing protein [Rubrivivax sp.]|nr:O-antigen ligase C-terminal domain-containing protein [Rubrivivax sp.]
MKLSHLLAAAVPLAWLLPNHYLPWQSAWQEGLALALLFVAAATHRLPGNLAPVWMVTIALALLTLSVQWTLGRMLFHGDAVLAALYILAFGLAFAVGSARPSDTTAGDATGLAEPLALGIIVAALVSAAIGLVQWTGVWGPSIWVVDIAPGGRPSGNVAQPNHLCTIAFLGLCAVALLREAGRLGPVGHWLASGLFLFTMVMSGSRTGWLQIGAALVLVAFASRRTTLRVRPATFAWQAGLFGLLSFAWPVINEAAILSGARSVGDPLAGSGRELLWPALLHAVWREPWFGYGWQQVVLAQQAVALDHPPILRHFEHSHNLILDFVIWVGLPFGVLIVLLSAVALWRQAALLQDARAAWLLAGVLGVATHAMLEFPLEYAYFLLPVGLMLGVAHALTPAARTLQVPRWAVSTTGAALLVLLAVVAVDYLKAEENHRILRLESARIGVTKLETPAPDLLLLDQLQAFLSFTRNEAMPGMSAAEVDTMRRVSERFAYPPAMFRFALAAGLNGQPTAGEMTIARLCRMHAPARCDEAIEGWAVAKERFPQLQHLPASVRP